MRERETERERQRDSGNCNVSTYQSIKIVSNGRC